MKKQTRRALLRGQVRSLVKNGAIETSQARARALKSFVDKLVSAAKENNLAARRRVEARLGGDRQTTRLLFSEIAPKFEDRISGFTRIIKLGRRLGDRSERVKIQWVEGKKKEEK